MMQKVSLLLFVLAVFIQCNTTKKVASSERTLVWSDEFDYEGLPNPAKWNYDIGTACDQPAGCGWGNKEIQYYTEKRAENARVEDGKLIITAIKEAYKEERVYTSARLNTLNKGNWKYGRVEIRAKLPQGRGTWPAIWMLSSKWEYGGWPESGEIDIMEHVGHDPDTIYGTVHTKAYNHMMGTHKGGTFQGLKLEQEFHDYAIEWTEDKIEWFVNGERYFTFKNDKTDFKAWPFDKDFYLILNLAVGGTWGGAKGVDESIWPQRMEIDYVRVYQ